MTRSASPFLGMPGWSLTDASPSTVRTTFPHPLRFTRASASRSSEGV